MIMTERSDIHKYSIFNLQSSIFNLQFQLVGIRLNAVSELNQRHRLHSNNHINPIQKTKLTFMEQNGYIAALSPHNMGDRKPVIILLDDLLR